MRLFAIITFISSSIAFANQTNEAVKKTAEAFSKTEIGREISKQFEKAANKIIPVGKEAAAVIGSAAVSAAQGRIDTKSIKNMDMKVIRGTIRPDVEHSFKEGSSSFLLNYNLNF